MEVPLVKGAGTIFFYKHPMWVEVDWRSHIQPPSRSGEEVDLPPSADEAVAEVKQAHFLGDLIKKGEVGGE